MSSLFVSNHAIKRDRYFSVHTWRCKPTIHNFSTILSPTGLQLKLFIEHILLSYHYIRQGGAWEFGAPRGAE
jgi:hypothetical protein